MMQDIVKIWIKQTESLPQALSYPSISTSVYLKSEANMLSAPFHTKLLISGWHLGIAEWRLSGFWPDDSSKVYEKFMKSVWCRHSV